MAHTYSSNFRAVVGQELYVPLENGTTGLTIGSFTNVWLMLDGVFITDQAPYALQLVEVDALNAPGYYFVRITPQAEGTLHLHMTHTSVEFDYTFRVERVPEPVDPGLEGDVTLTIDDGANPVEGATVRVFNAAGTAFVARALTDAVGQVTFTLPVGTYLVRVHKKGVTFANPAETIVVVANEEIAPRLDEVLPQTASIGDWVVLRGGHFHADSTEVLFGSEAVVAVPISHVSPYLDSVLVQVPVGVTATAIALRVRKPDPNNLPSGTLLSNTITLVRI